MLTLDVGRDLRLTLQYKTLEPIFQALHVEIDQKSMPNAGEFHVGEQLRLVDTE